MFGYQRNQLIVDTARHFCVALKSSVTPRQSSSFQISDWLVWQLRVAFEFSFTWKWLYWNQVQGRKVAYASKQATLGDSGVTLQNTVHDIKNT